MRPHTRAAIAAAAHAFIMRRKVAGVYDHTAQRHLKIAAESRDDRLQGFDGDRSARFGGTLPELYDEGDRAFITLDVDGRRASGYDRGSATFYTAEIGDHMVQLFDHGEQAWHAFDMRVI